jgi:hypothetical protein
MKKFRTAIQLLVFFVCLFQMSNAFAGPYIRTNWKTLNGMTKEQCASRAKKVAQSLGVFDERYSKFTSQGNFVAENTQFTLFVFCIPEKDIVTFSATGPSDPNDIISNFGDRFAVANSQESSPRQVESAPAHAGDPPSSGYSQCFETELHKANVQNCDAYKHALMCGEKYVAGLEEARYLFIDWSRPPDKIELLRKAIEEQQKAIGYLRAGAKQDRCNAD